MNGQDIFITVLLFVLAFSTLYLSVVKDMVKDMISGKNDFYKGKAKLIAKFTDEQGCFLCEFEKDGKIINAVYGFEKEGLKVGDEVDIVWDGLYTRLPHVMDKEVYDRDTDTNANQGRRTSDNL